MGLAALVDFDAVALHGGFGPASRATGRPKASLSRRVRALEASLGVRLIDRGTRTLRLTDEGLALHRRSSGLLKELNDIGEELADAGATPRGRLRVSVPAMSATREFGRVVAAFVAAYPAVALEVVAEDRFVDPVRDGFDIVLRANPAPDSDLVGQCVRRDVYVVAAHPSVAVPPPSNEPRPVAAVVIAGAPADEIWHVEGPAGALVLRPMPMLRLSSIALLCGAALGGAGAGLFPRALVADDLDHGRLVEWGRVPDRNVEVWALHSSARLTSAKVRLFLAALKEAFAVETR